MALSIPGSFIEKLLATCDIVEIMRRVIPTLNKKGKNYISHCPFHHENTPSFTVNADKQFYYCFGCKASGNAISFVMQYERLNFVESVQWLANDLQIPLPVSPGRSPRQEIPQNLYQVMEQALLFYQTQLQKSQSALSYLHHRNISNNTIDTFKLGFAPPLWDGLLKALQQYPKSVLQSAGLIIESKRTHYYDRFRSRIIFPIRDQRGRCVGFGGRALSKQDEPKYLNSPETTIYHKKSELYGLFEITHSNQKLERIWIVEGYMDVLSIYQSGNPQVVATLGTSTNHTHLQKLFQVTEEVIFCFDGDDAGHQASMRALETSLICFKEGWSIRFLLLPQGEDPDSWINQSSHHSFNELLSKTLSLSQFLFQKMQSQLDLNTPEGKSKLIQRTLPLLKKLPISFMREKLFEQLGYLVNTDPQYLTQILFKPQTVQYQDFKKPKIASLQNRAISFLIQYPNVLGPKITTTLLNQIGTHYPLLYDVLNCIYQNSPNNTAILLEHFRQQPDHYHHLGLLTQHNWLLSEAELLAEFQEICIRLEQEIHTKSVAQLLKKAQMETLCAEEKQELMSLLAQKSYDGDST